MSEKRDQKGNLLVPLTYWVTRDSDIDGTLEPDVDVWMARPVMVRLSSEGGINWYDESDTGLTHRWKRLPIALVAAWRHTVPETDRECIRVDSWGYPQSFADDAKGTPGK